MDNAAAPSRLLAWFEQQAQIARVCVAKEGPGPFVQHVRVDTIRTEQRDPTLPHCPLGLKLIQIAFHRRELLLEILLRTQTMVPGKGVRGEITNEQRGKSVETKHSKKRAPAAVGDHAGKMSQAS